MSKPDPGRVRNYLLELQKEICSALEQVDGAARFGSDPAEDPDGALRDGRALHLEEGLLPAPVPSGKTSVEDETAGVVEHAKRLTHPPPAVSGRGAKSRSSVDAAMAPIVAFPAKCG